MVWRTRPAVHGRAFKPWSGIVHGRAFRCRADWYCAALGKRRGHVDRARVRASDAARRNGPTAGAAKYANRRRGGEMKPTAGAAAARRCWCSHRGCM